MKKLLALLILLASLVSACALPIEPSTDSDSQVEDESELQGIEHNSLCYGFPYMIMGVPQDQGTWIGSSAGQTMYTPFWASKCSAKYETMPYVQNDGQINLVKTVGWPYSTCWKATSDTVVCNNQAFVCPVNACLTLPLLWQYSPTAPDNVQIWGWQNPAYGSAPGNHGIWPTNPTQCSNGAPTIQFNPTPSGGAVLSCNYPMGTFSLTQF